MKKNELIEYILRHRKYLTREDLAIFSVDSLLMFKAQIEAELGKKTEPKPKT